MITTLRTCGIKNVLLVVDGGRIHVLSRRGQRHSTQSLRSLSRLHGDLRDGRRSPYNTKPDPGRQWSGIVPHVAARTPVLNSGINGTIKVRTARWREHTRHEQLGRGWSVTKAAGTGSRHETGIRVLSPSVAATVQTRANQSCLEGDAVPDPT